LKDYLQLEELVAIRRTGFDHSGYPIKHADLDLVNDADQITFAVSIEDEIESETELDVFEVDPTYDNKQDQYANFKREILGEKSTNGENPSYVDDNNKNALTVQDQTKTNVINLRRTIYLTIMSCLDFEEAGHKLFKITLLTGQEIELVTMIIECCIQERTYLKYFGLLAQRFCNISRVYQKLFEKCFEKQYILVHKLETNMIRNVAKFYALLLVTDAISWEIFLCIRLTIEDTISSSRIFIKILFQEMAEIVGITTLNKKIWESANLIWLRNIFPRNCSTNIRFVINFFTSIGLGSLTSTLRTYLRELPQKLITEYYVHE